MAPRACLVVLLLAASLVASFDEYDEQTHFFGDLAHMDELVDELRRLGLRPAPGRAGSGRAETVLGPDVEAGFKKEEPASSKAFSPFPVALDDEAEHNLVKRTAAGDEDVSDILEAGSHRQGRLFYNFDRGSAFNTSVAFTIPLFSFSLPGSGDVTDGLDGTVFGTMAFVSLFLLGGLGVAIYTTTQGAIGDTAAGRSLVSDVVEITPAVLDILAGLSGSY